MKGTPVKAFVERHQDKIIGVLSGFDRVLFRGTLRSISYAYGLDRFLGANRILLKDFGDFSKQCTQQIAAHGEKLARDAGRPYIYPQSPSVCKEDYARRIAESDNIRQGLICVLYAVEPCMSFEIHRNRQTKQLDLLPRHRKWALRHVGR